jgi:hypothetical protein
MSLPFLLIVVAGTTAIGWASLYKSAVAVTARREAWQKRSPQYLDQAQNRHPLAAVSLTIPLSGEVYCEKKRDFIVPAWLGGSATAISGNAVLAGSWDHDDMPRFNDGAPHFGVLYEMTIQSVSGLEGIASLLK